MTNKCNRNRRSPSGDGNKGADRTGSLTPRKSPAGDDDERLDVVAMVGEGGLDGLVSVAEEPDGAAFLIGHGVFGADAA